MTPPTMAPTLVEAGGVVVGVNMGPEDGLDAFAGLSLAEVGGGATKFFWAMRGLTLGERFCR